MSVTHKPEQVRTKLHKIYYLHTQFRAQICISFIKRDGQNRSHGYESPGYVIFGCKAAKIRRFAVFCAFWHYQLTWIIVILSPICMDNW